MAKKLAVSEKTIQRLSLYRRLLSQMLHDGAENVYSHELAHVAGGTAAQVRRDMMSLGFSGSPRRGYDSKELIASIGDFLDEPEGERVALVGIGNMGRALLAYFVDRRPRLAIKAAFDTDPAKAGRMIHGCYCHSMEELDEVVKAERIRVAIITVPAAVAQDAADRLARAGVTGIVNFAPVSLRVPDHVFVEQLDVTSSLEKAAFYARQNAAKQQ